MLGVQNYIFNCEVGSRLRQETPKSPVSIPKTLKTHRMALLLGLCCSNSNLALQILWSVDTAILNNICILFFELFCMITQLLNQWLTDWGRHAKHSIYSPNFGELIIDDIAQLSIPVDGANRKHSSSLGRHQTQPNHSIEFAQGCLFLSKSAPAVLYSYLGFCVVGTCDKIYSFIVTHTKYSGICCVDFHH